MVWSWFTRPYFHYGALGNTNGLVLVHWTLFSLWSLEEYKWSSPGSLTGSLSFAQSSINNFRNTFLSPENEVLSKKYFPRQLWRASSGTALDLLITDAVKVRFLSVERLRKLYNLKDILQCI